MKTKHFGERLRRLRTDRELTVRALAAAAGDRLSRASISAQERSDTCHLRPENLTAVVDALAKLRPLEPADVQFLRFNGTLPSDYKPPMSTAKKAAPTAEQVLLTNKGNLRKVLDRLHEQIKQEAASSEYIRQLLAVAKELDVHVDLEEDTPAGV